MSGFVGRFLFRLAYRLRGSRTLELYDQISDYPFKTAKEARALQLQLLKKLLRHSARNVPYYRRLFQDIDFDPDQVEGVGDLARIPPLTKQLLRENSDALRREDVPESELLVHHSGGSTGSPVSFFRDTGYIDISDAGVLRNLAQSGWTPGEMVAFVWGFDDQLNAMGTIEFEARQHLRRFYQFDPFASGERDMARWVQTFRRVKPTVVLGYASTVARFARYVRATSADLPPLKGVFTTAEKLHDWQRETIESALECKAYDCYGSSEVQNIAAECPHGSMHINLDFVVVETAGAEEGVPAPLLVTSLRNYATPFIRYENGDMGSLTDAECPCGRGFPLMNLGVARVSDTFILPNGDAVHGEFFTHLMYGVDGVDTFQFHQIQPDHVRLRIVELDSGPGVDSDSIRGIVERVHALHPRMTVEVEMVSEIELSEAGKHRFTRSDVSQELG